MNLKTTLGFPELSISMLLRFDTTIIVKMRTEMSFRELNWGVGGSIFDDLTTSQRVIEMGHILCHKRDVFVWYYQKIRVVSCHNRKKFSPKQPNHFTHRTNFPEFFFYSVTPSVLMLLNTSISFLLLCHSSCPRFPFHLWKKR